MKLSVFEISGVEYKTQDTGGRAPTFNNIFLVSVE